MRLLRRKLDSMDSAEGMTGLKENNTSLNSFLSINGFYVEIPRVCLPVAWTQ